MEGTSIDVARAGKANGVPRSQRPRKAFGEGLKERFQIR